MSNVEKPLQNLPSNTFPYQYKSSFESAWRVQRQNNQPWLAMTNVETETKTFVTPTREKAKKWLHQMENSTKRERIEAEGINCSYILITSDHTSL